MIRKWTSFLLALMVLVPAFARAQEFVPGEVLVKYRANATGAHSQVPGSRVVGTLAQLGVNRVALPANASVNAAVALLNAQPDVEYAEPNYIAFADGVTTNDPRLSQQWDLAKIGAGDAWALTIGSAAVKVAVLDTGYTPTHEDVGSVVLTQDFTGKGNVIDGNGHGTHTSGTVAAATNNGKGVAAIGWGTSLMIGKVLDDTGSGAYSWIVSGITWAADNGANIISMSLGGTQGSTTLKNALAYAAGKGVLIIAAAGNSNTTRASYPAYYDTCVAVAATDQNDAKASFSNYGSWVDCAAPGVSITSLWNNGGYAVASGTSMATPLVAGLAALVKAKYPTWTADQIRTRIISTGTKVTTGFKSYPTYRINAALAVQ